MTTDSKDKALEILNIHKNTYKNRGIIVNLGKIEEAFDVIIQSEQEKSKKEKEEIFKEIEKIIIIMRRKHE